MCPLARPPRYKRHKRVPLVRAPWATATQQGPLVTALRGGAPCAPGLTEETAASLCSPSSRAPSQGTLLSFPAAYGTVYPSSLYFAPLVVTDGFNRVFQLSLSLGRHLLMQFKPNFTMPVLSSYQEVLPVIVVYVF